MKGLFYPVDKKYYLLKFSKFVKTDHSQSFDLLRATSAKNLFCASPRCFDMLSMTLSPD
jgi:hypothetical protein